MIELESYKITFNEENKLQELIDNINPSKTFVLVDENTEKYCVPILFDEVSENFELISIPQGEQFKNLQTCQYIWHKLVESGADRHSLLLNLGGGVIGDMGGFCASTYMRGIPYVHIPTTLLSQVDSSVGGKLGVDYLSLKNMIGVFGDPLAVMIDTRFLKTLPYRQVISGFAEIVKHALISDHDFWLKLCKIENLNDVQLIDIITRSIEIKKSIVQEDPYELGLRKVLNFGHTVGHAIETMSLENEYPLLHGEAIAIGMIMESHISLQRGLITEEDYSKINNFILSHFGNKSKSLPGMDEVYPLMTQDKKNRNGQIMMTLLNGIGQSIFDQNVSKNEIESAFTNYQYLV